MRLMRRVFQILVVCSCWRPLSWTSPLKMFLYTVYRAVTLLLIYSVMILQFVDLVVNVRNQDEFSDNFYLLLAMFVVCFKICTLLRNREVIVVLTNILEKEPFLPQNDEEIEIRTRLDRRAQFVTLMYVTMVETTVASIAFTSFLKYDSEKLPYRMWLPTNYSSEHSIRVFYVQQMLAMCTGSLVQVACDCLICSLLIHTYSQIEILGCRLKKIKRGEKESVNSCVRYHQCVYRYASMINKEFQMVIFVQFSVSTLVVCVNLYILTTTKGVSFQFLQVMMYTCCMLTQIFVYCWFGNEVKWKSLDVSNMVFESDWTLLDETTKKVLLMIMRRAAVPIEMTTMHIVPMNLESFVAVLKTSYSAYNLLQSGQG